MNDINFGAGTLFVGKPDGELHPLGECEEMELCEAVEDKDIPRINDLLTRSEEVFTITLSSEQVADFISALFDIRGLMGDRLRACGHARIAHLAAHAKKRRTRVKNYFRGCLILAKEAERNA